MKQIEMNFADNSSLGVKVFKEIEKAILTGGFKPGDSLVEMKLSSELGVSRTPVREALRQLELEGLIKTIPNKGAVVVGISSKDIEDIYTIRSQIEGLAAKWATEKIDSEGLKQLCEIVELQEFYSARGDYLQVWQLDTKFHELIYDASASRPLKHTLSHFHNYIQKARELSFKTTGRAEASVKEHRVIYEAIANKQSDIAKSLIEKHILNANENFLSNIKI